MWIVSDLFSHSNASSFLFQSDEAKANRKLLHRFDRHIRVLPIVGFNSGKSRSFSFDCSLVARYLRLLFVGAYDLPSMLPVFIRALRGETDESGDSEAEDGDSLSVVKRGSRFLAVYTRKLVFLDMVNYLAPCCSYAR